ncbi:MAG TPA: RNA polymerase sigma factor [Vicinamibacterales bacterium]|jgi:RNA polymerase sigma factor (sigma-70 family)|nr:RNA polymerase sigma factor [Vicinamibacterales bacterium]
MPEDRTGAPDSGQPEVAVETTVELLLRARQGDPSAIEQLFARHLAPLQRFAQGRLPGWARDLTDTDDLVQDALLQTLKRLDGFESRHPGALQAYLRQAVMNRMRDELRRQARTPGRVDLGDDALSQRSPVQDAVGAETMAAYEEALTRLTPEEREAVIGRVELGLSYGELALALEKPTADAARKAAQRALVRLAREMQRER